MTKGVRLGDYATTPLYNIKAVVQVTDISSSTLRAWERRYNVCSPQRSQSGYRLYSDRDVALIKWLKSHVDSGMSISQAVSWYNNLVEEDGPIDEVILPKSEQELAQPQAKERVVETRVPRSSVRDFSSLRAELFTALISFQEEVAERILTEAFSLYTLEEVGDNLITPVLVEIGQQWHDGILSITREHYATGYLRQRLVGMLRSFSSDQSEPLIWVGCAPNELHEIGSILLCIYLRRAGYQVRYLGQDLPTEDMVREVNINRPAMVLLSATTLETADTLAQMTAALSELGLSGLIIGYGGQVFVQHVELRKKMSGIYMGSTAQEAVDIAKELL